jgi:hypothetical protein
MTTPPTYAITDTTHTFTWDDGTTLELRDPARERRRLWADTLAYAGHGQLLNHKQVDLMAQADCDRFAAGCAALDGSIAWGPRLLFVGHHLTEYLAQQEPLTPVAPEVSVPWPQLEAAAYYGLAGEIVRTIEPHTESDPVALLVQLLVMFGSAIGRTSYFPVEADRHYTNMDACLVGPTSKGRKGTSAGHPRRLLTAIDPAWGKRVKGGLSSGEGIIWQVRDPVYGRNKKKEEICLDEGVDDKRLCVLETEFARGLAKTGQEGNVLSAVLRQAWDHGTLETLVSGRTKSPVNATHAHVSVIAHITTEELRRLLTETEAANGFGNRFLWVCTRRSKLLPEGGMYPEDALRPLCARLKDALFAARQVGQMCRSAEATQQWRVLYQALAEGYPGLVGALLARAEAQVLRLSCLYALLDGAATIDAAHLAAASALWRYCDASARYIFGTILGDPLADDIIRMLRQMASDGMTRTEINNALGRNYKSAALGRALDRLLQEGHARCTVEKTSGRPIERWFACASVSVRINELNEKSPAVLATGKGEDFLNSFNSSLRHATNEIEPGCSHTQMRPENGQIVCLDCGELFEASPPPPAFVDLAASALWCSTCGVTVSFRTLTQLDGTDVYLCNTCDTEVGRKHTTVPASNAGTHAPNDVLLKGQTAPPVVSSDNVEEF